MPHVNVIYRICFVLFVSLVGPACTTLAPVDRSTLSKPGVFPRSLAPLNLCEGAVTDQRSLALAPLEKPGYLQPFNDPAFGSRVVRITQSADGGVHKPLYNTIQSWNSDESKLLLYRRGFRGSDYLLFDGHSYEPLGKLNIAPADVEEVFWSRHDPDRLFYVSSRSSTQSQFVSFDVSSGQRSLIKDFSPMCVNGSVARGGTDVHMQSLDDDLFGFRCEAPSGGFHLMSYRISTDELSVIKAGEGNTWDNWTAPMPAPSGEKMWLQGDVISTDLTTVFDTLDMANDGEHGDIGLGHKGQDTVYQTVFDAAPNGCNSAADKGVGHLGVHSLDSGECRAMITESEGWPYTTSGTHVSAGAFKQPGWVAMSSVGYSKQLAFHQNQKPAKPLFSEIYLAYTNPTSPQVCRVAHHRSYGKFAKNGGYPAYFGEPHPSHSPSGTRIVFGSDWQDSGSVDAYVVELPGYTGR